MSNNLANSGAKPSRSVLFGAAFLMATSAIGPGFLTQTSTFTAQHGAALALVIVLVILMDITYTHGHDSLPTENAEPAVRPVYQDQDDDEEQPHRPSGSDLSRCERPV